MKINPETLYALTTGAPLRYGLKFLGTILPSTDFMLWMENPAPGI